MYRYRRNYFHSSLARTLYERLQTENEMRNFDKNKWYVSNIDDLRPSLRQTFLQLDCDNETDMFLENCREKADSILVQIFHCLAVAFLTAFMTKTSINGLLSRGSMFVFSHQQFEKLLGISSSWKGEDMLDLGAGDGKVTQVMSSYFERTAVTEASGVMARILSGKGFQLLDVADWYKGNVTYDVISCLNLLDRCDRPLLMLQQMASKLRPGTGRAIVAVVVPYHHYVEFGGRGTKPSEWLKVEGETFEDQVSSLETNVFVPAGFEVERWTRLPYLCEGNLQRTFYWLTDAVFVLKVRRQDTWYDWPKSGDGSDMLADDL